MGETRVDLQHLLEDLRDAYTGSLDETVLTEIVANSLDSGATAIRVTTDPAAATITVVDDGRGMLRRELAKYHDVAASSKPRGEGIGFAGVGIKLGLLVAREVLTETRRGKTTVATRWHLASRHRAPWKWIQPPGLTTERGTAVRLVLGNPLAPLLDAGYLAETLRRHFEPLLEPEFDALLRRQYVHGVSLSVDGRPVVALPPTGAERVPVEIRLGRRRTPSAVGYVMRQAGPLSDERQGIAISTHGKIIKRGWDWLGLTPAAPDRVCGLIEVPELAACLTLNKSDFIRTGSRASVYVAYRKALQEVISRQLTEWGDARDAVDARPPTQRLERDLQRVLEDLADDFPLLHSLVERRAGGQKRLPLPGHGDLEVAGHLFATLPGAGSATSPSRDPAPGGGQPGEPQGDPTTPAPDVPDEPSAPDGHRDPDVPPDERLEPDEASPVADVGRVRGRRRPARFGLLLGLEARPDDPELGRLVESTVWINTAHPAYARAVASRALGYHMAITVAFALASLTVDPGEQRGFVLQFLAHWGHEGRSPLAGERKRPRTRREEPAPLKQRESDSQAAVRKSGGA